MTDPTITIAGLEARIKCLVAALRSANTGRAEAATLDSAACGYNAQLRTERDALAAQLAEVRAELAAAPKVCAIHSYEHGPGPCMTCGAWPPGTRELIAACQTRIAGLESAANERSAEVARLTAQLEAAQAAGWETVKAENQHAIDAEARVRELEADLPCNGSCDIALASRQVGPDGIVPRNARECAELWEREAARLWREETCLTARVAELEARPVLDEVRLAAALDAHGHAGLARKVFAHLGPVTLPPAQDRAEALARELYYVCGLANTSLTAVVALDCGTNGEKHLADKIRAALTRLGAPPTSPTGAPPEVFAGVSEEELDAAFEAAYRAESVKSASGGKDPRRAAIRAVLARLEVSLVAPVDPEKIAADITRPLGDAIRAGEWKRIKEAARATLIARGIPVTPERGK